MFGEKGITPPSGASPDGCIEIRRRDRRFHEPRGSGVAITQLAIHLHITAAPWRIIHLAGLSTCSPRAGAQQQGKGFGIGDIGGGVRKRSRGETYPTSLDLPSGGFAPQDLAARSAIPCGTPAHSAAARQRSERMAVAVACGRRR